MGGEQWESEQWEVSSGGEQWEVSSGRVSNDDVRMCVSYCHQMTQCVPQARRKSNLALRRLAMDRENHAALLEAPSFRWVVASFGAECPEQQLHDALKLARSVSVTLNLAAVIVEASTLHALAKLVCSPLGCVIMS